MTYDHQIDRAEELFNRGHVDEAGEIFKLLIQLDPDNVRALNNYGVVLFRQGDLKRAEEFFLQAVARTRDHQGAIANLADVYRASGRHEEADRILRENYDAFSDVLRPSLQGKPCEHTPSGASPNVFGSSEPAHTDSESRLGLIQDACVEKESVAMRQDSEKPVLNLDEEDGERRPEPAAPPVEKPGGPHQEWSATSKDTGARFVRDHCGSVTVDEDVSRKTEDKILTERLDILSDKKILHAPFEIAGNMARICRFLRRYGLDATDVNYHDTWLKYECSVNLKVNELPEKEQFRVIDSFAREAIEKYDIFHFHFGRSLYPDYRDLEILKSKGKKILFSFWGSEQRGPEWILYHQARFLGHKPPKPYYLTLEHYRLHKLINRYADVMFGLTCIPRGLFLGGLIDMAEWDPPEKIRIAGQFPVKKDPDKTYFLHAATTNWKKGSYVINRLIEECKAEGMPIEILTVSGLPPQEAKRIYAHADYALEQVAVGGFGLFGLEMMSWEIPILVYQSDLMDRLRGYPPVLRITKQNFKSQVEAAIRMKRNGGREKIARESRKWVAERADMSLWIEKYIEVYANLSASKPVKQFINLSWYEQEHLLQSGSKSDFYRYMIEHDVFKELGMDVPKYDRRIYN
ncbi:MAG: tetratricopeptide repeat protein [Deltaproteobacteria bacterium]|nr:tetratricopeptide repeat protein [Deltaproteobacteria bacterium]